MKLAPLTAFHIFCITGWSLLFIGWLQTADTAGFVLLLLLGLMFLLRYRVKSKKIYRTLLADLVWVALFYFVLTASTALYAIGFILFQGMFFGFFPLAVLPIILLVFANALPVLLIAMAGILGLVIYFWNKEHASRLLQRDTHAIKIHEMELLQQELSHALAKVEHISILTERSRISADIHDNAGHEIISGYISLQTVRRIMDKNPGKARELFDKSLARLNAGIGKMRDVVHNISAVTLMGVDSMRGICLNFPDAAVTFQATGDMSNVTVSIWNVLESLLKESLVNAVKHANPTYINVELDATRLLIRLQVQNDGVIKKESPAGSGLRNLRYRVVTVGGHLSIDKTDVYKLVCVIPIR